MLVETLFDFTYYCYERSLWHHWPQDKRTRAKHKHPMFQCLRLCKFTFENLFCHTRDPMHGSTHVQSRDHMCKHAEQKKENKEAQCASFDFLYIKRNAIISKPDTHSCMMIAVYVYIHIYMCVFSTYTAKRFYLTMLIILLQ